MPSSPLPNKAAALADAHSAGTSREDHIADHIAAIARKIRALSLVGIYHAGSGHPGGALSAADILAVLYGSELNLFPGRTQDPDRDRFILSKGHAAPALYAAWAASGFLEEAEIKTLRKLGGRLQGHPHVKDTPLAETSTGSLGQGFSVAIGMAMGLKHQTSPARVYALLGDGELQEGEVWEGAMCAAHHKLDNLCILIDYNKMQSDDLNANIVGLEPLGDKWRAFGWNVQEVDGHNIDALMGVLSGASEHKGEPTVIIAHTIKGKGVSYMENIPTWHGSVKMGRDETVTALNEFGLTDTEIGAWLDDA